MSRFIYFLQYKGFWVCVAHLGLGTFVACLMTIVGLIIDKFQIFGGGPAKLFLWQSYLLCSLACPTAGYDEYGAPVIAGIPFMIISFIGFLSGVPIYTLLSMVAHYAWARGFDD